MAHQPCNDEISDMEILARITNHPSQVKKDGSLRNTCMYPHKKRDEKTPDYFTNKISVVRACRGQDGHLFQWNHHVDIAMGFIHGKTIFRGFMIARVSLIKNAGFEVETAASDKNPYHAHIVIPDYKVPYREVESLSDVLPQEIRMRIDRLRDHMQKIEFDSERIISADYTDLCSKCTLL